MIALAPDLLTPNDARHPVDESDWYVFAFTNALWDAGFRAGLAMEHVRLATLHRELDKPDLKLK